ncbi:hypothetical protein [Arenimonas alkanexedens]
MDSSSNQRKVAQAPLSQRSGRAKLFIGIPLTLIAIVGTALDPITDIAKLLAAAAGAYVIVGIVELTAGTSLFRLTGAWDQLRPWKQRVISTLVIAAALVASFVLLPVLSRLVG